MRGEIHRAGRHPAGRPISTGPVTYPPIICGGMHHPGRSPALSLPGFSGTSKSDSGSGKVFTYNSTVGGMQN